MNEQWPIDSNHKETIINQLINIVANGSPEMQIAASKAIMAADATNQKIIAAHEKKLDTEHRRKLELIELAHRLGIVGNDSGSNRVVNSQPTGIK